MKTTILNPRRWIMIGLTVTILAFAGVAAVVIAAPSPPWNFSGESGTLAQPVTANPTASVILPDEGAGTITDVDTQPLGITSGAANPQRTTNKANEVTLPRPDEDGYSGPLPEQTNEVVESSGSLAGLPPDWETFHREPQPDDNGNDTIAIDAEINWSTYQYVHVAGTALRPRDSSVDWESDGSGGCLSLNAGNSYEIFNIHLDIPNGSRIEYLRLYYYDTSISTDSITWVTRYDDEGSYNDVTFVASTGNAGYGTTLSAYGEHIVDSINYAYVLNWRPYVVGTTMKLCGLRVAYRLP